MPSNAPAWGTVSRCEPMSRRGAAGLRGRIDAAQIAGVHRWRRSCRLLPSRRADVACTSCIGSDRNVRVVKPGSSLQSASARQRSAIDVSRSSRPPVGAVAVRTTAEAARDSCRPDRTTPKRMTTSSEKRRIGEGRARCCENSRRRETSVRRCRFQGDRPRAAARRSGRRHW